MSRIFIDSSSLASPSAFEPLDALDVHLKCPPGGHQPSWYVAAPAGENGLKSSPRRRHGRTLPGPGRLSEEEIKLHGCHPRALQRRGGVADQHGVQKPAVAHVSGNLGQQ